MDTKKNKFLSNKGFVLFSILALIVVLVAIFAPVLSGGVDPTAGNLADAIMAPDAKHIFGTDKMGRDIFARVLYGARISLASTFALVLTVFVIGTALGVLAGYFGGWVDAVIMYDDRIPGSGTGHCRSRYAGSQHAERHHRYCAGDLA